MIGDCWIFDIVEPTYKVNILISL